VAFVHYTEASGGLPNSGRLSGTNGDLVGILDVVLVAAGWAIEFTTTNKRVYRPATGNRFRLWVQDDSAVSGAATLATVRGCEGASSATSVTDPFPTVAQIADGSANWLKSSAAGTTARNFDIWASDTWVIYAVNFSGTANIWEWHFFGDVPSLYSGDVYNTVCFTRNAASGGSAAMYSCCNGLATGLNRAFFTRSYDGTVKSTQCTVYGGIALIGGNTNGYAAAQSGPSGKVDKEKIILACNGSQSTTVAAATMLPRRALLPNLWAPLHGGYGSLNVRDTWADPSYLAGAATFQHFSTTANSAFIIVETTNTWAAPAI
jgi:hypothetical protein